MFASARDSAPRNGFRIWQLRACDEEADPSLRLPHERWGVHGGPSCYAQDDTVFASAKDSAPRSGLPTDWED